MNDYSGYGYDSWSTGVAYGADDPLFGAVPGADDTPTDKTYAHSDTGDGACGQWQGYDTSQTQTWDTSLYTVHGETGLHQQLQVAETAPCAPETGTYDAVSYQTGTYEIGAPAAGTAYGQWTYDPQPYEPEAHEPEGCEPEAQKPGSYETETHEPATYETATYETATYETESQAYDPDADPVSADATAARATAADTAVSTATVPRSQATNRGGSRRRRPAKRSALFSVAVPSVAFVGVAACAAAAMAVTNDKDDSTTTQVEDTASSTTAASTTAVSSKLDQQLAGVSRNADDFAHRASRTQERLDLKERQAAERARKAAEAARKEALRPKFFIPVTQHGLSAYFGQAGVNWMSVHTGIDFPVSYGTTVRAATDGTVRTQWNASYGNMALVTAPDGTETWYCHLSSTKIRSGSVKAGDVIAYSGNSGNSTGPHLHFEVHPEGGAAIDPLGWLLAKGLDPR